jgi:hypothetical protein
MVDAYKSLVKGLKAAGGDFLERSCTTSGAIEPLAKVSSYHLGPVKNCLPEE